MVKSDINLGVSERKMTGVGQHCKYERNHAYHLGLYGKQDMMLQFSNR